MEFKETGNGSSLQVAMDQRPLDFSRPSAAFPGARGQQGRCGSPDSLQVNGHTIFALELGQNMREVWIFCALLF
jgi:hypothetical protein